jgi:hypothetical protein
MNVKNIKEYQTMKRTIKVIIGAVLLALMGASMATAQTGTLQGRSLFIYDGGDSTNLNAIQLKTPHDSVLKANYTLCLPDTLGDSNSILVMVDTLGTMQFQDGLELFWGTEGNCSSILPWDPITCSGNFLGTCGTNDLDIRTGGSLLQFWFACQQTPVFEMNDAGQIVLNAGGGVEGFVILGNPGLPPTDAGIMIDCANPPVVGIEVNAIATGIMMPLACAPAAPFTGIYMNAQTTGIEIYDTPTSLYIHGATTGIDADGDIYFQSIPADPTDTRLLSVDAGTGLVSYRVVPANGDIVVSNGPLTANGAVYTNSTSQLEAVALTDGQLLIGSSGNAPVAGTLTAGSGVTITNGAGSITIAVTNPNPAGTTTDATLRWSGAAWVENTNLLSTAAGNTTVNGTMTMNGTVTVDPADIALDVTDTRLLSISAGSGVVGYRTVPANGDIVVSNGPLTNNGVVTTNATGQLVSTALTDGQIMIGSSGVAPVAANLTAGTGISITNGAGSISLAVTNPVPAGIANQTLYHNGTNWTASSALQNDGTNVTTTGNLSVNGTTTLGDAAADVVNINAATVDADNLPTSALSTNLLRRDATGNLQVSTATFPTSAGALTANRNVRTDGSGQLTTGAIALDGGVNEVTGILPVANGGTNSSTALNNDRIMVSSGGAIVEATALTDGQLLIGSSGAAPVAANLTQGTGMTITNGAGAITLAVTNPVPAGTTTDATLRWSGAAWVENTSLRSTAAGNTTILGTVTLDPADVANDETDTRLLTVDNVTGLVSYRNIAAGGNIITGGGTQYTLSMFDNVAGTTIGNSMVSQNAGGTLATVSGSLGVNDDLNVGNDATIGDADGDNHTIRGDLDINAVTNVGPLNVNINTTAFNHGTTIGNAAGTNTINLNSSVINAPNLPGGASTDNVVTTDGTQLFETTVPTLFGGYPWVRGGNAGALSSVLGTTDAVDVDLTANGIAHVNLNNADQSTEINTVATGAVTIGFDDGVENGTGTNVTNLNSELIYAPNLPADNTTTYILVYDNATGQVAKKDLGAPVQKVKSANVTLTGDGALTVFPVADVFVAAGATVTVTLHDGTDANDRLATITTITPATGFSIRLSGGVMGVGVTKRLHYTITNP